MRVLMIAPEPFLEPRGTPISVFQRAKGVASLGHRVDLITYHVGQDVCIPGVTIHRIPRVPFIRQVRVGPSWYKPILDLFLLAKAISLLATRRYDIIHSHEEAAFFSVFLASAFRTRHLYDMHSSLPRQLGNFGFGNYAPIVRLFEVLEKKAVNASDAVITIGLDLQQHVKKLNPNVPEVLIENLAVDGSDGGRDPQGVNGCRARLGLQNRLVIVYTGTFERYQGIELLIEGAKIVREQLPQAVFVLVGGNPQQVERCRSMVREQGLDSSILLIGTVPIEEVHNYVEIADILVSPRTEGTSVPLKIYSYLHAGKPIIATNLLAHTLVLNEDTAILVEPTNEALADGVLRLARNPELMDRLGRQAKKLAEEKYSNAQYLDRLTHIYQTLRPLPTDSQRRVTSVEN